MKNKFWHIAQTILTSFATMMAKKKKKPKGYKCKTFTKMVNLLESSPKKKIHNERKEIK
jgi:hypothetical protein